MNVTKFLSKNSYVFLPTAKHPKVVISIDNIKIANNSFNLYQPFSQKAKLFKKVIWFLFLRLNFLFKIFFKVKKSEASPFIFYLKKKLEKELISSVYISTIKDKVVLQLQSADTGLIGYLKYPLNGIGIKNVNNEKKAIDILSRLNIINSYILYDQFENIPFLLIAPLNGEIDLLDESIVNKLLFKFNRNEKYTIKDHPRFIELKKIVYEIEDLKDYQALLDSISQTNKKYDLVYEHGDFAPWNIVKIQEDYEPFDFEYFVEDGIEYFDLIKYHFQIENLLNHKKDQDLIDSILEKISFDKNIFLLFLVKEIVLKISNHQSIILETKLINMLVENKQ